MVAGAGGYFAPLIRAYMKRSGAPEDTGIRVALKDRLNALKNPYAHLQIEGIDFDQIANSPMLWDPIRYLETCPSSDGACAMVLGSTTVAQKAPGKPAWVHATAMRTEPTMFAGRDQVNPQAGRDCASHLYKKAGIRDPRAEIDCCDFAPEGEGWKMTYEGATAMDGDLPVNMSGGVLSSNPIGASGMLRFAEIANQIRGRAGEHQIDGAKKGLGHAYGGGSQFFSMWIVGDQPL
jgi:acetyl-CoA C-acetyltransferase